MVYRDVIYRLLRIPESVTELTAYHLLRVHPKAVTPELVARALQKRKNMLRQNIPGPQFIPIVSIVEQVLDQAAHVLSDPVRREKYNRHVLRKVRGKKAQKKNAKRREKLIACRQAVKSFLNADGTLDDAKRPELLDRLRELGLAEKQAHSILEGIPTPTAEAAASREASMQFFVNAIDMEIQEEHRLLSAASERKLLELTERLDIAKDLARRTIDERLAAVHARRGEPDVERMKSEFATQVRQMHPEGRATPEERRQLLALAETEGLSTAHAVDVLREHLEPLPTDADDVDLSAYTVEDAASELMPVSETDFAEAPVEAGASPGEDDEPIVYDLLADDEDAMARLRKVLALAAVATVTVGFLLTAWLAGYFSEDEHTPTRKKTTKAAHDATHAATDAERLLDNVLSAADAPDVARTLIDEAEPDTLEEMMQAASDVLITKGQTNRANRVRRLFAIIVTGPPKRADLQQALVTSLLRIVRRAADGPAEEHPRAHTQAKLLASLLFLQNNTQFVSDLETFAERAETSWTESCSEHPADPLNDPARLADAVIDGGYLGAYAPRADDEAFTAVTERLADIAAEAVLPHAADALQMLKLYGLHGTMFSKQTEQAERVRKAVRLALCRVLSRTPDADTAEEARRFLAVVLQLDATDPLGAAPLDTVEEKQTAAAEFEKVIRGLPRDLAALPTPTRGDDTTKPPPTKPEPTPKTAAPDVTLKSVRSVFSDTGRTQDLLGDVAVAMLARCDRVERFTGGPLEWSPELSAVTAPQEAVTRTQLLTGVVILPKLDLTTDPQAAKPKDETVDAETLDRLRKDIDSNARGQRYRAIERLKTINTPTSAAILTERLRELATKTSRDPRAEASRILRALLDMDDEQIPMKLTMILGDSRSNTIAHLITRTLQQGTTAAGPALAPVHASQLRKTYARMWELRLRRPRTPVKWGKDVSSTSDAAGGDAPRPAWQPEATTRKLVALIVHHAEDAAERVKTFRWGDRIIKNRAIAVSAEGDAAARLLAALVVGNAHLGRLVRQHPRGKDLADEAHRVLTRGYARKQLCNTELQRASVALRTEGELLELLIRGLDAEGKAADAIKQVRTRREKALAAVTNVLAELRENVFYNLALWDLLLKFRGPP